LTTRFHMGKTRNTRAARRICMAWIGISVIRIVPTSMKVFQSKM